MPHLVSTNDKLREPRKRRTGLQKRHDFLPEIMGAVVRDNQTAEHILTFQDASEVAEQRRGPRTDRIGDVEADKVRRAFDKLQKIAPRLVPGPCENRYF
jgi:hypothetical protein